MKRNVIIVVSVIIMIMALSAGCAKKNAADTEKMKIGGLKGPTTMGLVQIAENSEKYEFKMAAAADEITPLLLKGELDAAAIPANLAAALYAKSEGALKVIAVDTLGVLYIAEKGGNDIQKISDLKGKTIYATGKGTTPEYCLKYLVSRAGVDPEKEVKIVWKSEPSEVVAELAANDKGIAMLPQPFATVAATQLENFRIAIDMNKEWDALENGSRMVTAVIVARKDFIEKNPRKTEEFLKDFEKSVDFVNNNTDEASQLIEKYGIVKAAIAKKALPFCNIVSLTGAEMKTALSGYLQILFEQNPASVGGKMPADDFYYA